MLIVTSPAEDSKLTGSFGISNWVVVLVGVVTPAACPVISLEKTPDTNNMTTMAPTVITPPSAKSPDGNPRFTVGKVRICRDSTVPSLSMVKSSVPGSPLKPCTGRKEILT